VSIKVVPGGKKRAPVAPDKRSRLNLQFETTSRLAQLVASLEPGVRLPTERELSEQLGVGRSTLREAIRSLAFIGAIRSRQGSGNYVSRPDERSTDRLISLSLMLNHVTVAEMIEARRSFEIDIVRMAAERHDERDRERLNELMAAMRVAAARPRDLSNYDMEFHVALAEASHNAVMVQMIRMMRVLVNILLEIWRDNALDFTPGIGQIIREHEEILEAVFARDSERAARMMFTHLTNAGARVMSVLGRDRSSAEYIGHLLARTP
jgi:GntR family transcriptional regulator, transcriptional repressor for pyruvate dehydrogenase complex